MTSLSKTVRCLLLSAKIVYQNRHEVCSVSVAYTHARKSSKMQPRFITIDLG